MPSHACRPHRSPLFSCRSCPLASEEGDSQTQTIALSSCVYERDESVRHEHSGGPRCIEVSRRLGGNDFLQGLSGVLLHFYPVADRNEHVAIFCECRLVAGRSMAGNNLGGIIGQRDTLGSRRDHAVDLASRAGIEEWIHSVEPSVSHVHDVAALVVDVNVGVRVRGREVRKADFFLVQIKLEAVGKRLLRQGACWSWRKMHSEEFDDLWS